MSGHAKVLDAGDHEMVGALSWPAPKSGTGLEARFAEIRQGFHPIRRRNPKRYARRPPA
jgi:hypothetical protein